MKKKLIIPITILIIIVIILIVFIINKVTNKNLNGNAINNDIENTNQTEEVEEIKNETGATADTNIYQVEQEYDGREVLEIKPSVQVQTVWAGIIKQEMPTIEEINEN